MKIGIGLMASGKGSRMGENKLLMTISGKTMIEHMIDKMEELKAEEAKKVEIAEEVKDVERAKETENNLQSNKDYELEIVVASCYEEIIELAKKTHLTAIYNHKADLGQSESIKLIVKTLSHCEGIVFLPCDQIYLKAQSIDKLIKIFINNNGQIPVQASFQGIKSSPVIFPNRFYKDLMSLKGDTGGKVLLKDQQVILVETSKKELMDIDTREDIKG